MNTYVAGQAVRVQGSYMDVNRNPIDPAVVNLNYAVTYNGTTSATNTLTYDGITGIVKTSVGVYYYDIDTTATPGVYTYKWYSTGVGQATRVRNFNVEDPGI